MLPYEIFSESVQGATHIKKSMPCEDYGLTIENKMSKVFVLGDGHGDSNCPRSQYGSEMICKIAIEELTTFSVTIAEQQWEKRLFDKVDAEELVAQLITSIFGKWSCAVNEDYIKNPLSDQEAEGATEYIERYRKGERIEHIYGTTMIAGVMTDTYLLLLQQGDGRCVVFDKDGDVSQPIPWDDRCFANVTTSLCDTDAVQSCRYHIINLLQNPIIACFAGSDGVEDSFSTMDKMHTYYRKLLSYACENQVQGLKAYLKENLPDFSLNGSGDDTTICAIIDVEATSKLLGKFDVDNELIDIQDEIQRADERLCSMQDKLTHLRDKYESALLEFEQAKSQSENILSEYKRIEEDIAMFNNQDKEQKSSVNIGEGESVADSIKGIAENIKYKVLSTASVHCLQMRLDSLKLEKESAETKLEELESKLKSAESEYMPYKERYEEYQKIKEESSLKLNELKDRSSI